MRRTPIYHKQSELHRVVFRHPKHWVAQVKTPLIPTRECDPWQDLHGPVEEQETAIKIMYQRQPVRVTQ